MYCRETKYMYVDSNLTEIGCHLVSTPMCFMTTFRWALSSAFIVVELMADRYHNYGKNFIISPNTINYVKTNTL